MKPVRRDQQGFTLFELLVVVSVLAAMASIAAVAIDGYEQAAEKDLVHVEMKNISDAIHQFAVDTGHYPKTGIFQHEPTGEDNFAWLFTAPKYDSDKDADIDVDDKTLGWNPNASIGWNGPYLTLDSQQRFLSEDCDLDVAVDPVKLEVSISDTFVQKNSNPATCFTVYDKGTWIKKAVEGTEYHYETGFSMNWHPQCTGATSCIALVSAGEDGKFAGSTDTDSDDVVKVLRVN